MNKTVLIFGNGYVAKFLAAKMRNLGWSIFCTSRQAAIGKIEHSDQINIINFSDPSLPSIIKASDILLSTIPPNQQAIDPVLACYFDIIAKNEFEWLGYLSSTGVYGNHEGAWVDESTPCLPSNKQSSLRLLAEQQWSELPLQDGLAVHILRLSGIYGPTRNCLQQIMAGKNFTVIKQGQFFSRIHVADIVKTIIALILKPSAGGVFNVSDDEPAANNIVQQFGAGLLNRPSLAEISFADADLSDRAKEFFFDNKRVSNMKIKAYLNLELEYPNYRLGLKSLAGDIK
jgi:nucleoside-diphosphate-sugar epimerase